MSERPSRRIAVILERKPVQSRWETHHWQVLAVVPDPGGEPRVIVDTPESFQRLHPGFDATLYTDEAEGHYLNVTTEEPSVFVALRVPEEGGDPYPLQVTLSYNEAARWMDGGERVERAPMWRELAEWMAQWAEQNYRPEPKKRRKPRSFDGQGELREKKWT
jgi:Protein of unknown function (DUF3305)